MTRPPTDRRLLASNGVYAAQELQGLVEARHFVAGEICRIAVPVADLASEPVTEPGSAPPEAAAPPPLARQVLYGDRFRVLHRDGGYAFGQSDRGGYVGYVQTAALADWIDPNSRVAVRASLGFSAPDIRRPAPVRLPMGARVRVIAHDDRWAETACGLHMPMHHLAPMGDRSTDPVKEAEKLLGAPYLWGGNSDLGLDCSGLVQIACLACGVDCPGDSDQQEAALGVSLAGRSQLRRGDLVFWRGHVAWAVDGDTVLHANAFHMAVAYEDFDAAEARILSQGDGPVTARKRLEWTR